MKFLALSLGAAALLTLGACNKAEDTATISVAANVSPPAATPVAVQAGPALPSLGKAPAWHAKDLQGHDVNSDQFKGKVVVVDFWATWCGPCRSEIPGYVQLQKKYGGDGLVIVGMAVNEPDVATVQKFVQDNGLDYHIVMADDDAVQAFGATLPGGKGIEAIPTTFLIDRDGTIRDQKIGAAETADYEQRILKVLKPGI